MAAAAVALRQRGGQPGGQLGGSDRQLCGSMALLVAAVAVQWEAQWQRGSGCSGSVAEAAWQ